MTRQIIAADDSASVRMMVRFSLEKIGCKVRDVENGRKALEFLKKESVDMLITDLDMPELNGFDLVKKVRAIPRHRHLPIVILTTESDEVFKAKARAAGATGWITKPFRPDQLSKMVDLLLAA